MLPSPFDSIILTAQLSTGAGSFHFLAPSKPPRLISGRVFFTFFIYLSFFSYSELFKMSKYANHFWPLLNHKMQQKKKIKVKFKHEKNRHKNASWLKTCEYSYSDRLNLTNIFSRGGILGYRSGPRYKYGTCHISIPKSHSFNWLQIKVNWFSCKFLKLLKIIKCGGREFWYVDILRMNNL